MINLVVKKSWLDEFSFSSSFVNLSEVKQFSSNGYITAQGGKCFIPIVRLVSKQAGVSFAVTTNTNIVSVKR